MSNQQRPEGISPDSLLWDKNSDGMEMEEILLQALEDGTNNKPVDRFLEKMLVEICAGHKEGQSINALSRALGIDRKTVQRIVKRNTEIEARPPAERKVRR